MNPIVLLIVQALLKYGPELASELVKLFNNPAPSLDDWNKVFALADKSYEDYTKPIVNPLIKT